MAFFLRNHSIAVLLPVLKVVEMYGKADYKALLAFIVDEFTTTWNFLRNAGTYNTVPRESTVLVHPEHWSSLQLQAFKCYVNGTRIQVYVGEFQFHLKKK